MPPMTEAQITSAREQLDREMIQELLARRYRALTRQRELLNSATELQQIEQMLGIIDEELKAYGYQAPQPSTEQSNAANLEALVR